MCTSECERLGVRGERRSWDFLSVGLVGALRWERNKSNIDCRAALPPAGTHRLCRPGSKCFSPPQLSQEAAGEAGLQPPQHWDRLRPNDGAALSHTPKGKYTHQNPRTTVSRLIERRLHSCTRQTHTLTRRRRRNQLLMTLNTLTSKGSSPPVHRSRGSRE